MKKYEKQLLAFLFMGTIIIISLVTFLIPAKTYSENEKRILADFPPADAKSILSGEFQDGFETYISDHLFGRDFFVGVSSYFDRLMGRNSLNPIYNADDGYLVSAPKETGEASFVKNMDNFNKFTKENKIDSTIVIVPTAGYIMEDKLPLFHKAYKDDELFKLASSHTDSIKFLDVRDTLFDDYASGNQIYYRTDHHITSEGSYKIYQRYCKMLGMNYPSKEQYSIEKHSGFFGTTYSGSGYFLEKPDTLETWDLGLDVKVTFEDGRESDSMFFKEHLEKKDMYPVYLDGNHSYVHIQNPNSVGGNLLIIRDSYAQNLAPFLAYNYKNIHMLDMRYYRGSVAEFISKEAIDEILYIYGLDTLLTDESSSWLFF